MNIDFHYPVNTDQRIPSRYEKQEQKSSLFTLDNPFSFLTVPNQSFQSSWFMYFKQKWITDTTFCKLPFSQGVFNIQPKKGNITNKPVKTQELYQNQR